MLINIRILLFLWLAMFLIACQPVRFAPDMSQGSALCPVPELNVVSSSPLSQKLSLNQEIQLKITSPDPLTEVKWILPTGEEVEGADLTYKATKEGTLSFSAIGKTSECHNIGAQNIVLLVADQCPRISSLAISGPKQMPVGVEGTFTISGLDLCLDVESIQWMINDNTVGDEPSLKYKFNVVADYSVQAKVTTRSGKVQNLIHTLSVLDGSAFQWKITNESMCSVSACGLTGIKTLTFGCFDSNLKPVTEYYCTTAMPETKVACSTAACRGCKLPDGATTIGHGEYSPILHKVDKVAFGSACPGGMTRQCMDGVLLGDMAYKYFECVIELPKACKYTSTDGVAFDLQHQKTADLFKDPAVLASGACQQEARQCFNGVLQGSFTYANCAKCTDKEVISNGKCVAAVCPNGATDYPTCGSCQSGFYFNGSQCMTQICSPNNKEACSITNGVGERICAMNGSKWEDCKVVSCSTGYTISSTNTCVKQTCANSANNYPACDQCDSGMFFDGMKCVAQSCQPNSTKQCLITNGLGEQTCDAQGTKYGDCVPKSCNSPLLLQNGQCVEGVQACTVTNGTGTAKWDGSKWGACSNITCDTGYVNSNGSCVKTICEPSKFQYCPLTNGEGQQQCNAQGTGWGDCTLTKCSAGFTFKNGSCYKQACNPGTFQACGFANGSGQMLCAEDGLQWGACQLVSCNPEFHIENGVCESNTAPCTVANGSGSMNWENGKWGSCVAKTCASGYYVNNGVCEKYLCTPNLSQFCSLPNANNPTQTCNPLGTAWGECTAKQCISGFHLDNGSCVSNTRSCDFTNGYGSQTGILNADGSWTWKTCSGYACISNYHIKPNSNVCEADTITCPVENGYGNRKWDPYSKTYGTCQIASCTAGYINLGTACQKQSCKPGDIDSACAVLDMSGIRVGTGTSVCNATGTAFGSCAADTCYTGYHLENGSCLSNSKPCTIENGRGITTWDVNSKTWGSCKVANCNLGFTELNNSCVMTSCPNGTNNPPICNTCGVDEYWNGTSCAQKVCLPNAEKDCTVPNGIGVAKCAANGSGWSCQAVSCGTSYYLLNGTCTYTQCQNGATNYSACNLCPAGKYFNGIACVNQVCTPTVQKACEVANGTGITSCSSTGGGWDSCIVQSCNSNYSKVGNSCVVTTCTNGTSNPPYCTSCPSGKTFDGYVCK